MKSSSKKPQIITKLEDTFVPIDIKTSQRSPSNMERWWKQSGFDKVYRKFRKSSIKSTILSKIRIEEIGAYFNLQGYIFGGWTTQGDRYNYLAATAICLEDLNRVLKFRNNLGLNHHVGISFGARGRGSRRNGASPVAHYEPATGVINLTRYKSRNFYLGQQKQPPSYEYRFLHTGGTGSLCHELGHALDFYGGGYLDLDSKIFSLSAGRKSYVGRMEYKAQNNKLRNLLEDVLAAACLNDKEDDFSDYYKRIKRNQSLSSNYKEYLLRRTELVARLFEQYVAYKLKKMDIVNTLLTQKNYKAFYYPTSKEFEKVVKPFDQFIAEFRKKLVPFSSAKLKTKRQSTSKPKPPAKPKTKLITVKIPVSLQTIENHLWGKQLANARFLSKMTDKEFLYVWKYVLAGNAMLKKGINPSDLFNSNRHILCQVANDGIVKSVQTAFKNRGWEGKYTLFVEKKSETTSPKKPKPSRTEKPVEPPKTKLPAAKKHALPPHPVDRVALAEAIKRLEGMEQEAIAARMHSSFYPKEQGKSFIRCHVSELKKDVEALVKAIRRSDIDQYVAIYVRKCIELIHSQRDVVNWLITGRDGLFNARKINKTNDRHYTKSRHFVEWRQMRLEKSQAKRSTAIRGGTSDTMSQLLDKLDKLQTKQEQMKLANKILRSKEVRGKSLKEKFLLLIKEGIPKNVRELLEESLTTDNYYQIPSYNLTNNNATIRTVKKRIIAQEKHQERYKKGNRTMDYEGLQVVENAEDNRLELFFEDKPSDRIRKMLKGRGFKWSHKKQAWQRQLTENARVDLRFLLQNI